MNGHSFSLHAVLLPYLDETTLFNTINFSLMSTELEQQTAAQVLVGCFVCPSDPIALNGRTSYAGNAVTGGVSR